MIVDDTADVKQRTGFKFTCLPQELVGLLGVGLQPLLVHVEPVSGIERVFQELFELIDRANPVLHAFGGKGFRPASNVCDEIFSPSFRTAFVAYGIVGNKLEHAFGQNVVYQVVDMELAFLIVNLRTIVEETIVALREGVLVQVVVLAHPCFGNLKNLAVHNFKFLIC
mgnify:FL=1